MQAEANTSEFSSKHSMDLLVNPDTVAEHHAQPNGSTDCPSNCKDTAANNKQSSLVARMMLMQSQVDISHGGAVQSPDISSSYPPLSSMERPSNPSQWQAAGENISVINVFLSRYTSKGLRRSCSLSPQNNFEACQQFPATACGASDTKPQAQRNKLYSKHHEGSEEGEHDVYPFTTVNQQHAVKNQDANDKASILSEDSMNSYFAREQSRAESPLAAPIVSHAPDADKQLTHTNCVNDSAFIGCKNHKGRICAQAAETEEKSLRRNYEECDLFDSSKARQSHESQVNERSWTQDKPNSFEKDVPCTDISLPSNQNLYASGWSGKDVIEFPASESELQRLLPDKSKECKTECSGGSHDMGINSEGLVKMIYPSTKGFECNVTDVLHAAVSVGDGFTYSPGGNKSCDQTKGRFSPSALQEALHAEMER